jgi:hypothetical protein
MPALKLCLVLMVVNVNILLMTHQAELGNKHSQTGVWERDIRTNFKMEIKHASDYATANRSYGLIDLA